VQGIIVGHGITVATMSCTLVFRTKNGNALVFEGIWGTVVGCVPTEYDGPCANVFGPVKRVAGMNRIHTVRKAVVLWRKIIWLISSEKELDAA
jgi:hypothetical protein